MPLCIARSPSAAVPPFDKIPVLHNPQDMKHGTGQKESSEGPEDGSSGGTESEHIIPEGGAAASKGG